MNKSTKIKIGMGVAMVVLAAVMAIFSGNPPESTLVLFNGGMILIFIPLFREVRYGRKIQQDEFSRRLSYTSLAAGYQISIMFLFLAWWVEELWRITIDLQQFIALTAIVMVGAFYGSFFYFRKHPEKI